MKKIKKLVFSWHPDKSFILNRPKERSLKCKKDYRKSAKERFKHTRASSPKMEAFARSNNFEKQWSPEQIVGYSKEHKVDRVSHQHIYQFVKEDQEKT